MTGAGTVRPGRRPRPERVRLAGIAPRPSDAAQLRAAALYCARNCAGPADLRLLLDALGLLR